MLGVFTRWAADEEDEARKRMLRSETWEVVVPRLFVSHEPSATKDEPRTGFARLSVRFRVFRRRSQPAAFRRAAYRRALRQPAARASASEQNQRSPRDGVIRVRV